MRQSHAFLARLTNLLRDHYPDVLAELLEVGATEIRFGEDLPPTMVGFVPEPDDADLTMIACRRTTFEWILRRAALAEGNVEVRTGVAVDGLLAVERRACPGIPHVGGVHCADGTTIDAELVIVAGGRRSVVPEWLTAIGARAVTETAEDTGIVYHTRFYRLLDGQEAPPRRGPIGGDLGYLKYGVFAGDRRTFSVTLATPVADDELRRLFSDPVVFDLAARELVVAAPWLDGRAEPITPKVHMMAGLLNRWRDYVSDGAPVATGFLAVGDALLCTNPLYGRGCSTGFWAAHLMVEAVEAHGDDPLALALAYDAATRQQLLPLVSLDRPPGRGGAPRRRRIAGGREPGRRRGGSPHVHAGGVPRWAAPCAADRSHGAAGVRAQLQPADPAGCPGDRPGHQRPGARRVERPREPPGRTAPRAGEP